MVHEKFYQSPSLADFNVNDFLASLIRHLLKVYKTKEKRIDVQTNIDKVFLPIEMVLPVGFIASELVSNSLRHAFPGNREGEIGIYLHVTKDGTHELTVQDDGIGIPAEFTCNNLKSLGLDLVKSFAKKLNGE